VLTTTAPHGEQLPYYGEKMPERGLGEGLVGGPSPNFRMQPTAEAASESYKRRGSGAPAESRRAVLVQESGTPSRSFGPKRRVAHVGRTDRCCSAGTEGYCQPAKDATRERLAGRTPVERVAHYASVFLAMGTAVPGPWA
jgi:hypothetical protein